MPVLKAWNPDTLAWDEVGRYDHDTLTGLDDDDHGSYPLYVSQLLAPSNPPADRPTLWFDETAKVLKVWNAQDSTWDEMGGGGASDHGALTGLSDDDHPPYPTMFSQTAAPTDPVADRPSLWFDEDAAVTAPLGPGVVAKVTRTVQFSAATNEDFVEFTSVIKDDYGFWDSGANTRLTIPVGQDGDYLVGFGAQWEPLTETWVMTQTVYLNGAIVVPENVMQSQTRSGEPDTWLLTDLVAGDYLEVRLYNASGAVKYYGWPANVGGLPQFWCMKVTGVKGDQGLPGGDVTVGTTFPGSPTLYDKYVRSDIRGGTEFFWNGTYWLTTQLFANKSSARILGTGTTASVNLDNFGLDDEYDCYVYSFTTSFYVGSGTALSGSHSWKLRAQLHGSGTDPEIVIDSGASAVWRRDTVAVNALWDVAGENTGGHMYAEKTGTPGAFTAVPIVNYRVRAT